MPRRQRDLAVVGDVRSLRQPLHRLAHDLAGLAHLRHPHAVAVVAVAHGSDRDLEIEVLVGRVGVGLAQIPRVAGRAQQRAGHAELEQPLLVDDADALRALQEDLVAVQQRLVLPDALLHVGDERERLALPSARDVLGDASHLDVARVHALPRGRLEQVEDLVALAEAVPEDRDRAQVERRRAEPNQVRVDAVQLAMDHAQVLRALGHRLVEQLLHAHAEGERVEVVRQVVHALDERDHLPVRLVLAVLLDAGVDVADEGLELAHDLALERHQQPQHAVRGGMVRTEVDRQHLLVAAVPVAVEHDSLGGHAARQMLSRDRGGLAGGRQIAHGLAWLAVHSHHLGTRCSL